MSTLIITPGPVTTVTLHRPEVRNALNEDLIAELKAWADSVPVDGSVRVAVLQGSGPVFCAGADLQWMAKMAAFTYEHNLADATRAAEMLHALDTLPVPLIGRVHGAAMGGGVGLAAICDIVIAADNTRFGLTETTLGLVPAMISPFLVRKMGLSSARALALNGATFDAPRAMAAGLVHEVVPHSGLDAAVACAVAGFSKASPVAVAVTKRLLGAVHGRTPSDVLTLTAEVIAAARMSTDGQEGMRAFFERRAAAWVADLAASPADPPA